MASQRGRNAFEMIFFLVILVAILGAGIIYIGPPEIVLHETDEPVEVQDEPLDEDEKGEFTEAGSITYTIDPDKVGDLIESLRGDEEATDEDASEDGLLGNLAERIRNRNVKEETEEIEEE